MEIKYRLEKPYTEEQRLNFIVTYNHNMGLYIEEHQDCLVALENTKEETEKIEKQKKIEIIDSKIEELRNMCLQDLMCKNEKNIEIYNNIIIGLVKTKMEIEEN